MKLHPDVIEKRVEVGGTTVTYYDTLASNSPIVLLHGTGGSATSHFGSLYAMLAARHRVIAIDFAEAQAITDLVDQVGAVCDEAAPDQEITLVGYSLGAVVAAAAAARYRHQITRLVLVAGWIKTDNHQLLRNTLWQKLRDTHSPAMREFSIFSSYGPQFLAGKSDLEIQALLKGVSQDTKRDMQMVINRSVDISDSITRVKARTLVVACEYDQMVPKHHSEYLLGAIPDARLVTVPSGHAVVNERPAQLFSLIDAFAVEALSGPAGTIVPVSRI